MPPQRVLATPRPALARARGRRYNRPMPNETRRYGLLHGFYLSFYSEDFYRDVGRAWKGVGLVYLLVLLALAWLPAMAQIHSAVGRFRDELARDYLPRFPKITITKGKVSVDPPGPHIFKEPKSGKPFFIIDTAAKATDYPDTLGAAVIVTESQVITRNARNRETRIHDLSKVDGISFGPDDVRRWLDLFRMAYIPLAFPIVLLFSWSYRWSLAMLYAAIALLFGPEIKALGYWTLVRVASVAMTPVVVLDAAVSAAGVKVPMWSLFCLAIALGYLWYGAKAAASANVQSPT